VAPTRSAGTSPCWLRAESRRITERIAAWNDPDLSQLPVYESRVPSIGVKAESPAPA